MKTKNMRKKALLSSVAMLLVALVALSGATYAWFTTNNSATAKGVTLKTNQSTSLLFAEYDLEGKDIGAGKTWADNTAFYNDPSNWTANYTLKTAEKVAQDDGNGGTVMVYDNTKRTALTPCSMGIVNGSLTTALSVGNVLADGANSSKALSIAPGGDYWEESFYVSTTKDATKFFLTGVSAQNNAYLNGALRIAIKVGSNAVKIFALTSKSGTLYCLTDGTGTWLAENAPTFQQLYTNTVSAAVAEDITISQQTITTVTDDAAQLATLTAGYNNKQLVTITIWLEGNDPLCNNSAMGQTIDDFTFTFGDAKATA